MEKSGYIPKDQRKKILMITDDIRTSSGVGGVGRETVLNTCHAFNWVCIGGAIRHPEAGKRIDLSQDTGNQAGVKDASVVLYPTDGYGNPNLLRQIINIESPNALFLITDPRYFAWIFQMENEIRKKMPITYLNIWDSLPIPFYNTEFYESCDLLMGISKQTVHINKTCLESANIPYIQI